MKKLPLFTALDVENREQALDLVRKTKEYVQGYKIGPRLFLMYGPSFIREIKDHTSSLLFLDFKFYDIPSSTLKAVQSAFSVGADLVTVHAAVGKEALSLLSDFEAEAGQKRFFKILFVTVLSSEKQSPENQARIFHLAHQVYVSGLKGLVCPPREVKVLRQKYKDMFLATPGIRYAGEGLDDQKSCMSPLQALKEGSSVLIMGRSLIRAKDPAGLLENIRQSLSDGHYV